MDLNTTRGPAEPLQWATVVGLVVSARATSKARAVDEIYRIHLDGDDTAGLHPFDATRSKIENREEDKERRRRRRRGGTWR